MGGRREVSVISHRPVTSSDLKHERLFFRGSVSTFLQLVVPTFLEWIEPNFSAIGLRYNMLVPPTGWLLNPFPLPRVCTVGVRSYVYVVT